MKIGIIGLGLIGGSLAIDLRQLGHLVLGVSRRQQTCDQAIARSVVDQASTNLELAAQAELIFICTPLSDIESTVLKLIPYLSEQTVLTDVGSVKAPVVQSIAPHWPNFVGGHPMAGTAAAGLDAAQAHLFAGRAYVLTPMATTPITAIERVAGIANALQAQVHQCDPAQHDQAVAWISHLPVMVSASLIQACLSETDLTVLKLAQKLASSGFRDTSRVGGGNPDLGVLMAKYNQDEVLRSLYTYRHQLNHLIAQIEQQNWPEIEQQFRQTQAARPNFVQED
ncbi:MAG: prephenate/arogenate dehydrogenase [Cyanothece sp. SIO1E1]|nr:prephenate/arogenate dehydrogenase [Cyanothece sp. SIO1E1]